MDDATSLIPSLIAIKDLRQAKWNPRSLKKDRFRNLCRTIARDPSMLWGRPVLAMGDGNIYAGNMRWAAVKWLWENGAPSPIKGEPELDWTTTASAAGIAPNTIPAVIEDVSEQLAKERALRDNAQWGEWDENLLSEMVYELGTLGTEVETLGFDEKDLRTLRRLAGTDSGSLPDEDPDDLLPSSGPPTARLGDVWLLGNHRLYCGDATLAESYDQVLGRHKPVLTFTSPPYNVLVGSTKLSQTKRQKKTVDGEATKYIGSDDKLPESAYLQLLREFTQHCLARTTLVAVNIQQLAGNKVAFIEWLYQFRTRLVDTVIWDKGTAQPAMAKNVLNSQFEFVILLTDTDRPDRVIRTADFWGTESNVYAAPPQRGNDYAELNAATFPPHLPQWAMRVLDATGGGILDPFMGTGTTIIAAEALGRPAYGIELEPAYVDVTIRRWEKMTGSKAVLEKPRAQAD